MKKDCCLIATIPSMNDLGKVEQVFSNFYVSEVRFNTGAQTPYSPEKTLSILKELSLKHKKKVWIDIKGRQLRVEKWADPLYSCIELNHNVKTSFPAQICFRNGDNVNITHIVNGNQIFVNPLPRQALGKGQSVNILAKDVEIEGYLTSQDKEYLKVCKKLEMYNIMLSFVESYADLIEVTDILPGAKMVLKIESQKGLNFISQFNTPCNLMAARDDLFIETGQNYDILRNLKLIISTDPDAICASKIFLSLEKRSSPDLADFADLELMYKMGYRKFMLCDNVCNYSFINAIVGWRDFING